jgi:hypothetical protein
MEELLHWYFDIAAPFNPNVSETRDVFEARAQKFFPALIKSRFSENDASLLYSIVGEIGNNSFDHNLGMWNHQPGCYFDFHIDSDAVTFGIADHGRGMFSSLKRVIPALIDDQEAVETAFQKVISGRAPEQRGNGLKFVRQIINGNPGRALVAQSGKGKIFFGGKQSFISMTKNFLAPDSQGTILLVKWSRT